MKERASATKNNGLEELRNWQAFEAMREPGIFLRRRMTEPQLWASVVRPHSRTLHFGSFHSVQNLGFRSRDKPYPDLLDPVPAYIAQLVHEKVTLVDIQGEPTVDPDLLGIQSDALLEKLRGIARNNPGNKRLARNVRILKGGLNSQDLKKIGSGGLRSYRKDVQRLVTLGMLKRTGLKLVPGTAWNTGIKVNSQDLVGDRGTFYFIARQGKKRLERSITHYLELIRPGAKIVFLLQTRKRMGTDTTGEAGERRLRTFLKQAMKERRIAVDQVPLIASTEEPFNFNGTQFPGYRPYDLALIVTKLEKGTGETQKQNSHHP